MILPKYLTPARRKSRQPKHVPKATLEALTTRDGRVCAWSGVSNDTLVPQHRQGGMGGRSGKHRLSNLVWLTSEINGLIESDAEMQAEALMRGIKVSVHDDPLKIPVVYYDRRILLLDDDGAAISREVTE